MSNQFSRADLVDVVIQSLTHGLMKYANRVLEAQGFEGDDLLYYEEDANGNPINIGEWDFRPVDSDRTIETVPHLLIGRVLDWDSTDTGMVRPGTDFEQEKLKEDSNPLVNSTTTGGQQDGTLLVDGFVNFEQSGISHNQWVGLYDGGGNEEGHTFVQKIVSPHKVRLQEGLFYNTRGGEPYRIYHTTVKRMYHQVGITIVRFMAHTGSIKKATLLGYALRSYFETLQADDDLLQVELKARDQGDIPALIFVDEVDRVLNTSNLLSDNEISRGIRHRREIQVSLKASENLHRYDPASEIQFGVRLQDA